jgi:hypothetical protein
MDYIQSLVQDRYNVMMTSIDNYAKSLSHLDKDKYDKALRNYIIRWRDNFSHISNNELADPIMRQVADVNLNIVNSMLNANTRVS